MGKDTFNRPLIPVFFALSVGILICSYHFSWFRFAHVLIPPLFLYLVYLLIKSETALFTPLVLILILGGCLIYPYLRINMPPSHVEHYAGSDKYNIRGVVIKNPESFNLGHRVVIEADTICGLLVNTEKKVTGKIRVSLYGEQIGLKKGNRISFTGKIKPVHGFGNPGGFDYKKYMMYQKIRVTSYSKSENVEILDQTVYYSLWDKFSEKIETIRSGISDTIDLTDFSTRTKQVLKVLLTGMRSEVDPDTQEIFAISGTGHLLAISGLHTGIVAAFFMFTLSFLLSRSGFFLFRARVRKTAAFLTILGVVFYGILTGMSDSTTRAVIMITVFLLSLFFEKQTDSMNILALSGLLILMVYPFSLFSVSFIFSFTAVFFILLFLSGKQEHSKEDAPDQNYKQKIQTWFIVFFKVTVISSLATLPLTAFFFNRVSIIGIPANLVVVPAACFLVVPSGLLAIISYLIFEPLSLVFINLAGMILEILLSLITFFSTLPFAEIRTVTPTILEIVLYYIILISGFFYFLEKKKRLGLIMVGALILISCDIAFGVMGRYMKRDLEVTVLDVGQGTSVLIEFPGNKVMLFDSGGFYSNAVFDVGKNIVSRVLLEKRIKTLDLAILSHPESDHYNGFLYLADIFKIKRFFTNGGVSEASGYRELTRRLTEKAVPLQDIRFFGKYIVIGGVTVEILHPADGFLKMGNRRDSINNNSIVIKITHGDNSFLLTGDVMKKAEEKILERHEKKVNSQVLVVPHHGSKTSSSEGFIDAVNPEYAVFSAGFMNRYMPHKTVLDRYIKRDMQILRTDVHGAITFISDGKNLKVKWYNN